MSLFRARYFDGERLDVGGLPVRLTSAPRPAGLPAHRRARREASRWRLDPPLADAAAFAKSRRAWIAQRLASLPIVRALGKAERVVVRRPWRLTPDGRRPRLIAARDGSPAHLTGCGAGEVDGQLVPRRQARGAQVFRTRAEAHCLALAVAPPPSWSPTPARAGVMHPRQAGRAASIRLSWRLALAPFDVADYVWPTSAPTSSKPITAPDSGPSSVPRRRRAPHRPGSAPKAPACTPTISENGAFLDRRFVSRLRLTTRRSPVTPLRSMRRLVVRGRGGVAGGCSGSGGLGVGLRRRFAVLQHIADGVGAAAGAWRRESAGPPGEAGRRP